MNGMPLPYASIGYSQPALLSELYLPKRTRLQGPLYKTLTDGFKPDHVRAHFQSSEKRPEIIRLLKTHNYAPWAEITDTSIERLCEIYWGYSLYEVDGVFRPDPPSTVVDEERTQVIRVIFLPRRLDAAIDEICASDPSRTVPYLRQVMARFLRSSEEDVVIASVPEAERSLLLKTKEWYLDVGLFLIGYVVFEVLAAIAEVAERKDAQLEKEVWLTGFWHFSVNRFLAISKPEVPNPR